MILRVLQLVVATMLLVAAGGKLAAPGELAGALRGSRIFPKRAASSIAIAVVALEIALSLGILVFRGDALAASFAGVAALCAGFTLWGASVRARGIKLRCGCFGGASKNVSWWTVSRAAGLAALSVTGVLAASGGIALLEASAWGAVSGAGYSSCVLLLAAFARTRRALLLSGDSLQSISREARA
jgi:hypothetical protein